MPYSGEALLYLAFFVAKDFEQKAAQQKQSNACGDEECRLESGPEGCDDKDDPEIY